MRLYSTLVLATAAIALTSCQRSTTDINSDPGTAKPALNETSAPEDTFEPFGDSATPIESNPVQSNLDDLSQITTPTTSPTPEKSNAANIGIQAALTSLPMLIQCMSLQCDPNAVFSSLSGTFLNAMGNTGENGAMVAQMAAPIMGMFSGGAQ